MKMMKLIEIRDLPEMFASIGRVMTEKADRLGELDALMGDGDLGLTMKKGFSAMPDILVNLNEADIGRQLMKAGMKMASLVPSTMGTLMSSGIMSGGKALEGKQSIDAAGYSAFLEAFCEGVTRRGKCARGDRTLLDALGPASDSVKDLVTFNPGVTLPEVAETAFRAAEAGVEATKAMKPKFGKAAVHSAAAEGNPDQGATAAMFLLQGIKDYIKSR